MKQTRLLKYNDILKQINIKDLKFSEFYADGDEYGITLYMKNLTYIRLKSKHIDNLISELNILNNSKLQYKEAAEKVEYHSNQTSIIIEGITKTAVKETISELSKNYMKIMLYN